MPPLAMIARLTIAAALVGGAATALAGEADVLDAAIAPADDGTFRVEATVRHADEGWDHYADAFEVVAPDGAVLATRTLLHPHVDEQPFTRSLGDVAIPAGVGEVIVRARDSGHGYGGRGVRLRVPR